MIFFFSLFLLRNGSIFKVSFFSLSKLSIDFENIVRVNNKINKFIGEISVYKLNLQKLNDYQTKM